MVGNLILVLMFACIPKNQKKEQNDFPDWFQNTPTLCGVGSCKMRGNLGAAKIYAEDRARGALARQFESSVSSLIQSSATEVTSSQGASFEEGHTIVSKSISKQTLVHSRPVRAMVMNNEFFSLVCINPDVFVEGIQTNEDLTEAQRNALRILVKQAQTDQKSLNP